MNKFNKYFKKHARLIAGLTILLILVIKLGLSITSCRVLGLSLILIAWGVETFWFSKWRASLKNVEFITVALSVNRVDSDLKYIKGKFE